MSSDSNHHTALSSSPSPSSASSSSSSSPPSPSPPNPVSSLDLHANILFDYVFRPQNTSTTIQSGRDCQTHVNAILEQAKALDDIFQSHINPSASAISSASASASSLPSTQEPSAGSSNGASQLRQAGDSKAQAPAPVKEEKTDTTATEQDRYLAALKLEIQALRQEIREKDGLISVYAGKTKEWRRKFGALVDTNDATMKSALMM